MSLTSKYIRISVCFAALDSVRNKRKKLKNFVRKKEKLRTIENKIS